jgi:hypothetical protein
MFRNVDEPLKFQPCRALLKHHYRMAVLVNMKARAGYPNWDEDFHDGEDQLWAVSHSDQGKLLLENMLAGRLNGLTA